MKNPKNKKAFTFVELIMVTVILTILWSIWFIWFVWNLSSARDAERKSSFGQITSAMKLHKKNRWSYPAPENYFSITNGWNSNVVVWQWKLWPNVWLSTIDKIPLDPKLNIPYLYSITKNKQEFQIAWALENNDRTKTLLRGSYKSVSKTVLPTIILALDSTIDTEITDPTNKDLFIFDEGIHNFPYDFDWGVLPFSDWTDFNILLSEAEISKSFSQNSSFETCAEVIDAWKSIWNWDYQTRSNTWALITITCSWM